MRQIKDYEQKVRDDREQEHYQEEIEMNKVMKKKMEELPNKEVSFKLNKKRKGESVWIRLFNTSII